MVLHSAPSALQKPNASQPRFFSLPRSRDPKPASQGFSLCPLHPPETQSQAAKVLHSAPFSPETQSQPAKVFHYAASPLHRANASQPRFFTLPPPPAETQSQPAKVLYSPPASRDPKPAGQGSSLSPSLQRLKASRPRFFTLPQPPETQSEPVKVLHSSPTSRDPK